MLEFIDIDYKDIAVIKELWEKNRKYHEDTSQYFSEEYKNMHFEDRIKAFGEFGREALKITVAKENDNNIGYCLSTVINGKGEMQSLHVEESCRGGGIGRKLVESHLEWFREKQCKEIGVTVSQENESTIGFYRSLGFYPNTLYMQQLNS